MIYIEERNFYFTFDFPESIKLLQLGVELSPLLRDNAFDLVVHAFITDKGEVQVYALAGSHYWRGSSFLNPEAKAQLREAAEQQASHLKDILLGLEDQGIKFISIDSEA